MAPRSTSWVRLSAFLAAVAVLVPLVTFLRESSDHALAKDEAMAVAVRLAATAQSEPVTEPDPAMCPSVDDEQPRLDELVPGDGADEALVDEKTGCEDVVLPLAFPAVVAAALVAVRVAAVVAARVAAAQAARAAAAAAARAAAARAAAAAAARVAAARAAAAQAAAAAAARAAAARAAAAATAAGRAGANPAQRVAEGAAGGTLGSLAAMRLAYGLPRQVNSDDASIERVFDR